MITRDNYEELFLLYVDNELSPAERRAVEDFVTANPDLAEEWDLLSQCKIAPDEHCFFGDTDVLLQPNSINMSNYEAYFLSYIDHELDQTDAARVESFLRLHPALQPEMELLRRTVSAAEASILFPDKHILYRKEKDRKPVFLMWIRLGAAAAMVGAIVFMISRYGSQTAQPIAADKDPGKKERFAVTPQPADTLHSLKDTLTLAAGSAGKKDRERAVLSGQNDKPATPAAVHTQTADAAGMLAGNTGDVRNEDSQKGSTAIRTTAEIRVPAQVRTTDELQTPGDVRAPGKITALAVNIVREEQNDADNKNTSFATQALLAENGDGAADPDEGLTADPSSQKKSRLRGLFRKVSRVLEKRASRDDDEKHNVYFGGFALK